MREARRTLGCWLLAAFLERGGDPTRANVPMPIPLVRPLSGAELRRFAGPLAPVVALPAAPEGAVREHPAGGYRGGVPTRGTGRVLAFPLP